MAIYIPGWAEGLLQSGDLRRLGAGLGEAIAPDRFANQRLQQLVAQNPMLLNQIENMTLEGRRAMEQTLGYRKKTPLQDLPEGAQLKERRRMDEALAKLTPEQLQLREANLLQTLTPQQIERQRTKESQEDQKFQLDLSNGTLQNQLLTGQVKDVERIGARVDAAIAKYPTFQGIDMKKLVGSAVRGGTPIDPQLITAIQSDPGAKQLFDIAYTSELAKFKNELDTRLARTKSAQDETMLVRTLAEVGNQLNDQEGRILYEMQAALSAFEKESANLYNRLEPGGGFRTQQSVNMQKAAIMKPYEDRLTVIRKAAFDNTQRTTGLVEKLGIKTPTPTPDPAILSMQAGPVGPLNPSGAGGFNQFPGMPQNPFGGQAALPQAPAAIPVNETPEQRLARLRRAAGLP